MSLGIPTTWIRGIDGWQYLQARSIDLDAHKVLVLAARNIFLLGTHQRQRVLATESTTVSKISLKWIRFDTYKPFLVYKIKPRPWNHISTINVSGFDGIDFLVTVE